MLQPITYDQAVDAIVAAALSAARAHRWPLTHSVPLPEALDVLEATLRLFYGESYGPEPPFEP